MLMHLGSILQMVPKEEQLLSYSDFFHLFGNGTHTGSIGKNRVVFPPIGKKIAPLDLYENKDWKCQASIP